MGEMVKGWVNGWGTHIPGPPLASQQVGSIASHQTDHQGTPYIAPTGSRKSIQLLPRLLFADKQHSTPSPQL